MGDEKDKAERRLQRLLRSRLDGQLDEVMELLGDPPDINNLPPAFWDSAAGQMVADVRPELEQLALLAGERLIQGGVGIAWELVAEEAAAWAREHAGRMIRGVTDVSRRHVGQAVERYFEESGRTIGDLRDDLAPWFGASRAEGIAVTEVTQAAAEGAQRTAEIARRAGFRLEPRFHTNKDELVCPRCGPLDNTIVSTGSFPPIHVRCRCFLTHEWVE